MGDRVGEWKRLDSPRLGIPLELREVTAPGRDARVWEVQDLRRGCVFKVELTTRALASTRPGSVPLIRPLTDAESDRAVCLATEEALISPSEKEPGITYAVSVNSQQVHDAAEMSG